MEIEGWICLIVMVVFVVIALGGMTDTSNRKKAMDGHLFHLKDFKATQKVMGRMEKQDSPSTKSVRRFA